MCVTAKEIEMGSHSINYNNIQIAIESGDASQEADWYLKTGACLQRYNLPTFLPFETLIVFPWWLYDLLSDCTSSL